MVKRRLHLLSSRLDFLTGTIIFALCLLEVTVRRITLLFQLGMVVDMALADFFILSSGQLQRFCDLGNQICRKLLSLGGVGFHGAQLGGPSCQRSAFEGSRGQGGVVADAQRANLLRFAVVVFLAEGRQFGRIFFFNDTALAVELLDFVEP